MNVFSGLIRKSRSGAVAVLRDEVGEVGVKLSTEEFLGQR
jgi:hypothetical protein